MPARPDPHCWLSDLVETRPSPVSGSGLFAVADIAAGTVVSRLGGRMVSNAELDELIGASGATYVDTVSVYEDANLVLPPDTANHFGNHSCEPNLWWVDPFSLAARSDVPAGAELTVDYGTLTDAPAFSMTCACRAQACRGVVTGLDWQSRELQKRYGEHWVPVLRDRIRPGRL